MILCCVGLIVGEVMEVRGNTVFEEQKKIQNFLCPNSILLIVQNMWKFLKKNTKILNKKLLFLSSSSSHVHTNISPLPAHNNLHHPLDPNFD